MNFTKIITVVQQLEEQFPVESWTVDDRPLWPYLRVQLYFSIREEEEQKPKHPASAKEKSPSLINKLANKLEAALERRARLSKKASSVDYLFLSLSHYREDVNGIGYDRHADVLREHLHEKGKTSTFIDVPVSRRAHPQPFLSDGYLVDTDLNASAISVDDPQFRLPGYAQFLLKLADHLNEEKQITFDESHLAARFRQQEKFYHALKNFFKNENLKAAFIVCYYSEQGFALARFCEERGIPLVDIQHGMQHHPCYRAWTKKSSYTLSFGPSHFWVWDEPNAKPVRAWADSITDGPAVVEAGYLWKSKLATLTSDEDKTIRSRADQPVILLTLPTYPVVLDENLVETIRSTSGELKWLVRAHPRLAEQQAECARQIGEDVISVDDVRASSTAPLGNLIAEADIHLTWESTVIVEAADQGVPSIAIESDALEIFPAVAASGLITFSTTAQLAARLKNWDFSTRPTPAAIPTLGDALKIATARLEESGVRCS
ncbi:hypothetical protein N9891_00695 [bacterium]|nr:hypothetical protein [bacterium]